ncbi:MAG: tetratricopeptide repeat protein [Xenococcus sp. MO_188.B8]|nr:tetratricopeptide repeat protein [Xenococcus sp. MO_188.B8]
MEIFELYLSPINKKRFRTIVTQSGETDSSLPFSDSENDWRMTLLRTLEISNFNPEYFSNHEQEWMKSVGILTQEGNNFDSNYLVYIGQALYHSLFPSGKVENALKTALRLAESKNTQLHIQIRFEDDLNKRSRLADYPWELLHDGKDFLLHKQITFSRYIAHNKLPPNLKPVDRLNVLLVSSAAFDKELGLQKLSKKEQQAICKGLENAHEAGHINLNELDYATVDELREYLTEHQGDKAPHILHFDGHGIFGKRCKNENCHTIHTKISVTQCRKCNAQLPEAQGYLAFESETDKADYVSAKELGALLQITNFADGSQQSGGVALVVLSACQSAMTLEGESVFNGTAQNLINHQIPAVIAMQYSVSVNTATEFAKQFYRSLGQKNSLAVAISQGREAMGVEGNQWYRPVLYLRWKDNEGGQLFNLPKSTKKINKSPPRYVPYKGVKNFVGRQDQMKMLHEKLQQSNTIAISAITGMGGVGKTELATQYARKYETDYPGGTCWLNARDTNLAVEIIKFYQFHVNNQREIPQELGGRQLTESEQALWCWENWQPSEGLILVVWDDVTDLGICQQLLPTNNRFRLLITTRLRNLDSNIVEEIPLDVLSPEKSVELLAELIREKRVDKEIQTAAELCQWLGYLPLGLNLVGRYVADDPDLSLKEILQSLQQQRLDDEALEGLSASWNTAQRGVLAAFELSWQKLDAITQQVAELLSLFAPDVIPWGLVISACQGLDCNKANINKAKKKLYKHHLIQPLEDRESSYKIHPLIREFLQTKLALSTSSDYFKQAFVAAMVAIAQEIPETLSLKDIQKYTPVMPHIAEAVTRWENFLRTSLPFTSLGRFYLHQALYEQAKFFAEKHLSFAKNRLGSYHADVADCLNHLGLIYYYQGNDSDAECLLEEALQLRTKLLGKDHPDVADSLNNLGLFYCEKKYYKKATSLLKEALQLKKRLLGEHHPDIAASQNNLARIYYEREYYYEATSLLKEALQLRQQLLRENHPGITEIDVAESLNNIAEIYRKQGYYHKAKELHEQALQLSKQLLGKDHPDVGQSLNNLAVLYACQGYYQDAKIIMKKALEMLEKSLENDNPCIVATRQNLESISADLDYVISLRGWCQRLPNEQLLETLKLIE